METNMNKEAESQIKITIPEVKKINVTAANKNDLVKLTEKIIDVKPNVSLSVKDSDLYEVGVNKEWNSNMTCFSYQKEAAKSFIFHFNKCGILSDQVGMGKTIEAGIIVSELARRRELESLLVLVPQKEMSDKWRNELAKKFGFRNIYQDLYNEGKKEKIEYFKLPKVFIVNELEDLFEAIQDTNDALNSNKFNLHLIDQASREYDRLCTPQFLTRVHDGILKLRKESIGFGNIKPIRSNLIKEYLIKGLVEPMVQNIYKANQYDLRGYEADFKKEYLLFFDAILSMAGELNEDNVPKLLFQKMIIVNCVVNEFRNEKAKLGKKLFYDLVNGPDGKNLIRKFLKGIKKTKNILIVNYKILDTVLVNDFASEALMYYNAYSVSKNVPYTIFDLLVDLNYNTLIVDEAHNYIKVSHKLRMISMGTQNENARKSEYSVIKKNDYIIKYNIVPLFNDLYYIAKEKPYLKLKALADRTNRKIFMTATPIESDIIDFYLLRLLSNDSKADMFEIIRDRLFEAGGEEKISQINGIISKKFDDNLKNALNTTSHETLVLRYILNAVNMQTYCKEVNLSFADKVDKTIVEICKTKDANENVLRAACKNEVRDEFEEKFVMKDSYGNTRYIESIDSLVENEDGMRKWHSMYRALGIRSTRHQTFRLNEEMLKKIRLDSSEDPMIKERFRNRFRELPQWAKRNGLVIEISSADNSLDYFFRAKLHEKKKARNEVLSEKRIHDTRTRINKDYKDIVTGLEANKSEIELQNIKLADVFAFFEGKKNLELEICDRCDELFKLQTIAKNPDARQANQDIYRNPILQPIELEKIQLEYEFLMKKSSVLEKYRIAYKELYIKCKSDDKLISALEIKNKDWENALSKIQLEQSILNDKIAEMSERGKKLNDADRIISDVERDAKTQEINHDYFKKIKNITIDNTFKYIEKMHPLEGLTATAQAEAKRIIENDKKKVIKQEHALEIYNYVNNALRGKLNESSYSGVGITDIFEFKLHMIMALMTNGINLSNSEDNENMCLTDKALVFTTQKEKLYNALLAEAEKPRHYTDADKLRYIDTWKHRPLFDLAKEDQWLITDQPEYLNLEGNKRVLVVLEVKSSTEGLDFQKANIMINFDIPYSPLEMEQRIGRIDRVKGNDAEQPELQIISFTPLNDISGFMVDFLANDLKIFSCWVGDTTGIVSLPIGLQENTATFENAIRFIDSAYKSLYALDAESYVSNIKEIVRNLETLKYRSTSGEENKNGYALYLDKIESLQKDEVLIKFEIGLMKQVKEAVDEIAYNFRRPAGDGTVYFDDFFVLADDNNLDNANKIKDIYEALDMFYKEGIKYLKKNSQNTGSVSTDKKDKKKGVESNSSSAVLLSTTIQNMIAEFEMEQKTLNDTYKKMTSVGSLNKDRQAVVFKLVYKYYRDVLYKYLTPLLDLFSVFCDSVKKKAENMSKIVEFSTIEEYKTLVIYERDEK